MLRCASNSRDVPVMRFGGGSVGTAIGMGACEKRYKDITLARY